MKILGFTQKRDGKLWRTALSAKETATISHELGTPALLFVRGSEARLIPLSEIAEVEVDPDSLQSATRGGSTVAL